jgi:mRNA-degrading endonuclease RelE of RelBE toxin-antitoxin system
MALTYAPGCLGYLRTVGPKPRKALRIALRLLDEDPRHPKLRFKLLRVKAGYRLYRARIGDYRIVYSPQPDRTFVFRIQHRDEGYEWLEHLFVD